MFTSTCLLLQESWDTKSILTSELWVITDVSFVVRKYTRSVNVFSLLKKKSEALGRFRFFPIYISVNKHLTVTTSTFSEIFWRGVNNWPKKKQVRERKLDELKIKNSFPYWKTHYYVYYLTILTRITINSVKRQCLCTLCTVHFVKIYFLVFHFQKV